MKFALLALTAALAFGPAHAQGNAASAPASSPAKKELVQKVLKLQQSGIEMLAAQMAEQPAMQLMQQAGMALQQQPADKREAIAKEIQADVKKYADETLPPLKDKAVKLAPSVIGPMLEERFTEDELKQIVGWMESPVSRKFAQLGPEMQRALAEKLATDSRATVEPKIAALQASMAKRLGIQQQQQQQQQPAQPAPAKKK